MNKRYQKPKSNIESLSETNEHEVCNMATKIIGLAMSLLILAILAVALYQSDKHKKHKDRVQNRLARLARNEQRQQHRKAFGYMDSSTKRRL